MTDEPVLVDWDRGTIYAVVADPPVGIFGTWKYLGQAMRAAYAINGYVVRLPIAADMRESRWTENPDRVAYEQSSASRDE